ncbi:MAG: M12 family metallo-peptidase [Planctomycetota bacterium]
MDLLRPFARRSFVACALLAFSLSAATELAAQNPTPARGFPLLSAGLDTGTGLPLLRPAAAAIAELAQPGGAATVQFTGFPWPAPTAAGGAAAVQADLGVVTLELRRLAIERFGFGFQVDGQPAPGLLEGLALSVWTGRIANQADSEVLVSFSRSGSFGWLRSGNDLVHLLGQPGPGNNWNDSQVLVAREGELAARGLVAGPLCAGNPLLPGVAAGPAVAPPPALPAGAPTPGDGDCSFWTCPIAIETDYQLYEQFSDLGATTAYLTTLLSAIGDRYLEQIDTVLTFPYVQFYTTPADPWSTPDVQGSTIDLLNEFAAAWQGAIPADAKLGHIISGAELGGGVAYLAVLCDTSETYSFAVSANISGDTPFPIAVSPLNWDYMVVAHETGHNFGSPHTHDFVPQIDDCANGNCITNGTIMSYCHLCSGGLANITTYFAPECVDVMQDHAGSCLDLTAPLVALASAQPALIAPFQPTPLQVEVQGTPVGNVNLNYRYAPAASFSALAMSPSGGGQWTAILPAAACGEQPEWFFSMVEQTCGLFATESFSAEVGNSTTLLFEDFEVSSGWTVGDAGDDATTGIWERGDPNGTGAQSEDDFTASGTDCFFTGQGSVGGSLGDNDVDGGQTTLTSPLIDLSSGNARIGYWRWYSNDAGSTPHTDVFVVEVSNGGAWVNVETVGPTGDETSGGWFWHEFSVSDFVTPNASVRVRFIASDENDGSIVEAAIDDLSVFRVTCGSICQTNLGSGGPGTASLTVCGGNLSTGTTATFAITGATPNVTAHVWVGLSSLPTFTKGGVLVPVPPTLHLLLPLNGAGAFSASVPGGNGPVSLYVQATYSLPSAPAGWGFTNAVRVDLLP